MDSKKRVLAAAILAAMTLTAAATASAAEQSLGAEQLVAIALSVNPAVRGARARWQSAVHAIKQNYAPSDPIFTYTNLDSPTNGISEASVHTLAATASFQFPGKAFLHADVAERHAEIARLTYVVTARDVRAAIETAYYQALLDGALAGLTAENARNLERVLKVTEVAYAANRVTQTDFISAEFDLKAAEQRERELRVAGRNDETTINQLLYRPPGSPLNLDRALELGGRLEVPLDRLVERAAIARQEILEAALTERNSATALQLAKLEYAPDYTVGYIFDHYLLASGAPSPTRTQDHGFSIGFTMPVFFWLKQNEDIKQAGFDLAAARDDLSLIRSQTAALVTSLYRTAQLAYETATVYRGTLIPLARQNFEVALVAYSSGKIDFVTLAGALTRNYGSRLTYLQAVNQHLAGRVALEQAIGEAIAK